MQKKLSIWQIGNTGLRSPSRISEGFALFASSAFVGNLHGKEPEYAFMRFLHEKGIIKNDPTKDVSASHARKWRLMFCKCGLIYPKIGKTVGDQLSLGSIDEITPFGYKFLRADTYAAQQDCYLRAFSVEQYKAADGTSLFSPLRWTLALMLEIERRTGSSEITRTEFALWAQASDPTDDLNLIVDSVLELRKRRKAAQSKKAFDRKEREARSKLYSKKAQNFFDYCDMNMRYLRITGIVQRKGRGLVIVPTKHALAVALAKSTVGEKPLIEAYRELVSGASLPSDDMAVARQLLEQVEQIARSRSINYDIDDIELDDAVQINIARLRIEEALRKTDELLYAERQHEEWREIVEYMKLIERGGGVNGEDEDTAIVVPKDETPAYLEWIMWRAALAVGHMANKPYEARGFKLDADFLPSNTAGGGRGDLYCEFDDFLLVTEVSMSSGSRQEAMEGEPVRRHVSDAMDRCDKPVLGLFVAVKIDTNTAETFRHGLWYDRDDRKRRLDILPLTLSQYRGFFSAMFERGCASPELHRQLINRCAFSRDFLTGPAWKGRIDDVLWGFVAAIEFDGGSTRSPEGNMPAVGPGATIEHSLLGIGHVLTALIRYDGCPCRLHELPFVGEVADCIEMLPCGDELLHAEKGHAVVVGYRVAFCDRILYMSKEDALARMLGA